MKNTVSMSVYVVDKVRTVSDTKREFYTHHTRPIVSVYRRIVEELMVEMHLLSVNVDFKYDPIYALGVVTAFERFMQGYQPEKDKASIFAALCRSIGNDPEQYRQQAGNVLEQAKNMTADELIAKIGSPSENTGNTLVETLQAIANQPNFKYSRLFAIGLYTVLAETNLEIVKDKEKRDRTLQQISEALHFPPDKLQKDLDIYRSNLDKMDQLLGVLEEALQAEKKKRVQQETEGTNNSTNDVKS